ncbi:hypothetical protein FLX56_20405 [Synechococcus moorigangaii CMS01]|nr:hypothetical protein [Synechococcus moorigangaii CMS01]
MTVNRSITPFFVTLCLGFSGADQALGATSQSHVFYEESPVNTFNIQDLLSEQQGISFYHKDIMQPLLPEMNIKFEKMFRGRELSSSFIQSTFQKYQTLNQDEVKFITQSFSDLDSFIDSQISPEQVDLNEGIIPNLPIQENQESQENQEIEALEKDFKEAVAESTSLEQRAAILRRIILRSLSSSSQKYPFLIDPTDNFTFEPNQFNPFKLENYGQFDIRITEDDFTIDKLTYGFFPQDSQFYWILPNNRIIFETQGWVGGIQYQGKTRDIQEIRDIRQEISLWGLQAVWNIPRVRADGSSITDILPIEELRQADITTLAAQVTSNSGLPSQVIINSGIDFSSPNIIDISEILNSPPGLGETSTNSTQGGKNLFEGLEDERTPLILQAFPTNNLSPLLDNDVLLSEGSTIPQENLINTGIIFGDFLKGQATTIDLNFTSVPGVKFARPFDDFENLDLLNVLVNPELTKEEYERRYLNSLLWNGIRRRPQISDPKITTETTNWYQGYISRPHKRAAVTYHSEEPSATFTEIFANPGLGFTAGGRAEAFDDTQSLNSTTGLLLGGIFEIIDDDDIQNSLNMAKDLLSQGKLPSRLKTQATPQELRDIGLRLDKSLLYADFNTNILQTSGRLTNNSYITPKTSRLWQLRTGLYPRRVQITEAQQLSSIVGEAFFSQVDISKFGQLTFVSTPSPEDRLFETSMNDMVSSPISSGEPQTTFGTEVILTTPSGQQFVQRLTTDSTQFSSLPNAIKSFDIAFDRINIARIDQIQSLTSIYEGISYVPTIELAYAGSSNDWYYSFNAGVWATLNNQTAPGIQSEVVNNNEPKFGAYLKGFTNVIRQAPILNKNEEPIGIKSYGPTFRFNTDTQERFNLTVGYEYSQRRPGVGWTVRPTLFYSQGTDPRENQSLRSWVGLLDAQIGWQSGLSIINRLELGEQIFASLIARQKLNPNLSIGIYTQNFDNNISGLRQREEGSSMGLIIRYDSMANNASFYEGKIGTSENGLDLEIRSRFVF